ncbi:MAG: hypothetical protein PHH54_06510 [Candidatus Nanoarchaeia archaeon]|nr:hypothetical protein [Candidatus Nanoarchaeia archaeon]MDD5741608.1 hypothetical protein [Candidatus Nanoarchaeia archaeon]
MDELERGSYFGKYIFELGIAVAGAELYSCGCPGIFADFFDGSNTMLTTGLAGTILGSLALWAEGYSPLKLIEGIGELACLPYDKCKCFFVYSSKTNIKGLEKEVSAK